MPTNSLERALLLLDLVEKAPGGLRNAEISRQLRIPRSSCSWILTRLEQQGYLQRDGDSSRYRIGLKMIALAHGALRDLGFRSYAEPVLYRVASETGLAAGIGVLESGHVLLVDRVEPPEGMHDRPREERDIGRELPAHTTALGKVLLAWLPRRELMPLLEESTLPRMTAKTIVSPGKLIQELRRIRQRGYAVADEEHESGIRAVSAPIFDMSGTVRAALSLNGSPRAAIWKDMRRLTAAVLTAAEDISVSARFPWSGLRWQENKTPRSF